MEIRIACALVMGRMVSIHDYTKSMGPAFCIGCGERLAAKKGKVKAPHYSHTQHSTCRAGGVSAEHLHAQNEVCNFFNSGGVFMMRKKYSMCAHFLDSRYLLQGCNAKCEFRFMDTAKRKHMIADVALCRGTELVFVCEVFCTNRTLEENRVDCDWGEFTASKIIEAIDSRGEAEPLVLVDEREHTRTRCSMCEIKHVAELARAEKQREADEARWKIVREERARLRELQVAVAADIAARQALLAKKQAEEAARVETARVETARVEREAMLARELKAELAEQRTRDDLKRSREASRQERNKKADAAMVAKRGRGNRPLIQMPTCCKFCRAITALAFIETTEATICQKCVVLFHRCTECKLMKSYSEFPGSAHGECAQCDHGDHP